MPKYYIKICIRYVDYSTMAYKEVFDREDFDEPQENVKKALCQAIEHFYTEFKDYDIRGLDIIEMHLFD